MDDGSSSSYNNHHDNENGRNNKSIKEDESASLPSSELLQSREAITGWETFVAGLSPSYWAHVPLLICDILRLKVTTLDPSGGGGGGLYGLVLPAESDTSEPLWFPLTRCRLVATIVYKEVAFNSIRYVLDDGTGLLDCIMWTSGSDNDNLLSYILEDEDNVHDDDYYRTDSCSVGDVVWVLGRVQPILINPPSADSSWSSSSLNSPSSLQFTTAIFEIHCSRMDRITESRSKPQSLNKEYHHWADCCLRNQRLKGVRDTLSWLGPQMSTQVAQKEDLPSSNETDADGSWRVFGNQCRCTLSYMNALLYCHCKASPVEWDSDWRYRDTLLCKLLELESLSHSATTLESPYRFLYTTLAEDPDLVQVAREVTGSHASQLIRHTFRALRKDGILYLVDSESDTYLLISRSRVLEPYIRELQSLIESSIRVIKPQFTSSEKPEHLVNVPKERLSYLKDVL
jgi:hypothetical protein